MAQGYNQKYGSDYDETFCPVVRQESLRTLVALSTQFGLELHHVDVATAFLDRTLEEEVYMSQGVREGRRGIFGMQTEEKYLRTEAVSKVLEHGT